MTLDIFFKKFDQFADAPGAVAKMRELVLHLAVQGKLEPQHGSDKAVEVQIEPSQDRRSRKLISGNVEKSGRNEVFDQNKPPYAVPENWIWEKLGTLAVIERGGSPRPIKAYITNDPDGLNWIKIGDTEKGGKYITSTHEKITREGLKKTRQVYPGDFLLTNSMSFGRPYISKIEGCIHDGWLRIHPVKKIAPDYLYYLLSSSYVYSFFRESAAGAVVQNLNAEKVRLLPIPLPPLAEQKRIVAKVDELMALCDRLEAQQQARDAQASALARASLARFAQAPTPANLNLLFHKSYSISPADLRKAILTLAVQGKIVSQDPQDEPANSILLASRSLFEGLVAVKKLSAPKPLPPIKSDEVSFALPRGWAWCRFGQLMRISSGDGLISKDMNDGPIPVYGGNGVTGYHDTYNVSKKTLVIGRVGFYCGSIHVTPEKAWITDNAFITTFEERSVDLEFLCWLLKATDLRARNNATAQPVISGGKVYPIILALPPFAEQRRIVAKVDQLMALVDQLETQLAASRATGKKLLEALVVELTNSNQS